MSHEFDGVNDVDSTTGQTYTLGSTISVSAWIKARSQGENNSGRIFTFGSASGQRWIFGWNGTGSSKKLRISNVRASASGTWDMTTGFTNVTGWKFVAFSLDISSTSNDPTLWTLEPDQGTGLQTLTVGSGLTEVSTPSGALSQSDPQIIYVGNNSTGASTFDGFIGEFAIYPDLASTETISHIAHNGVLAATAYLYWPMDQYTGGTGGSIKDYSGNGRDILDFSATGVEENPPIRTPGRRG